MRHIAWSLLSVPIVLVLTGACSDDDTSADTTGGSSSMGGSRATTGGAMASGGAVVATGGSLNTGGLSSGGASAATGGLASKGGSPSKGGASSGGGAAGSTAGGGEAGSEMGGSAGAAGSDGSGSTADPKMNLFVTSDTSATADLGGLSGADQRCQGLAAAVGHGDKTWHAYLSAVNPPTNAIDRISEGPYYNSKGELIADDKATLHARAGDAALFLDEKGNRVNGQWAGSPTPNQHDILTGTQRDGTLASDLTCGDWTARAGNSQVGHSDGLGPNMATSGTYSYWNSAHTGQCGDTQPGGGAGRLYCFVAP